MLPHRRPFWLTATMLRKTATKDLLRLNIVAKVKLREVTVVFGLLAVGLFAASVTVLVMVRRSRRTLPPETEPEEEARLERRLRDLLYQSRARRATKREDH